jgi:hypothetical protein
MSTMAIAPGAPTAAGAGAAPAAAAAPVYRGSIDCLRQTVRAEGFMALYKGFIPALARLGPWGLVFFLVYEPLTKKVLGKSQI